MARILFNGEWYEEVAGESLYETDYQEIILQRANILYPEHYAIRFDTVVTSETGSAKADFALVDREYRDWWVVEVEMEHHDFRRHVMPQVRVLSEAGYGTEEADCLCRKSAELDPSSVVDMLKGKQPRVLVIVNRPQPSWARELSRFGACVAVFEVFRSQRNQYVFRVNGEHPIRLAGIVTSCEMESLLPLLRIESPAGLGIPRNGRVQIRFRRGITEWFRIDSEDKVWLSPVSANPLKPSTKYEIVQLEDGSLEMRQIE